MSIYYWTSRKSKLSTTSSHYDRQRDKNRRKNSEKEWPCTWHHTPVDRLLRWHVSINTRGDDVTCLSRLSSMLARVNCVIVKRVWVNQTVVLSWWRWPVAGERLWACIMARQICKTKSVCWRHVRGFVRRKDLILRLNGRANGQEAVQEIVGIRTEASLEAAFPIACFHA